VSLNSTFLIGVHSVSKTNIYLSIMSWSGIEFHEDIILGFTSCKENKFDIVMLVVVHKCNFGTGHFRITYCLSFPSTYLKLAGVTKLGLLSFHVPAQCNIFTHYFGQ